MRLVSGNDALWSLSLGEAELRDGEAMVSAQEVEVLAQTVAWLDDYVRGGTLTRPTLAWERGSAFQTAVWQECAAIPWGQVESYGNLAVRVARRLEMHSCAQALDGAGSLASSTARVNSCARVGDGAGSLGVPTVRVHPCARAVGQALKANPWPLIVPCHRVVAARGRLGGYAYGSSVKAALLLHEGIENLSESGGNSSVAHGIF